MSQAPTPDIERLLAEEDWPALERVARELHPAEVAEFVGDADEDIQLRLFRSLPPEKASEVFVHFRFDNQLALVRAMSDNELTNVLNRLASDDRTRLFEQLPPAEIERALRLLDPEVRFQLKKQLSYPPESVGRLMSLNYVAARPEWTASRALAEVRSSGLDPNAVATVYVTDQDNKLIDMIDLTCLVLAEPDATLEQIRDGEYVALSTEDDREEAVRRMQKHDLLAIPVVDSDGALAGVVTVDDAMDVAEQEVTEDFHKQAGVTPLKASYPDIRSWSLFQKRLPWLAALIFVYLGASGVISAFEEALAAELVLAAFIPLLMGSGGNVGAQSGTLTVRALATGDMEGRRWRKALSKELAVGSLLGLSLAVLSGAVGFYRGGSGVALVIASSMLVIVITANVFGIVLPVLLAKMGVDPAVAGSPVITSVTDLTSLVIYLGIASQILI